MHPLCYFRTDNIDVFGPFIPGPNILRALDATNKLDTCRTHAQIDEVEETIMRATSARFGSDKRWTMPCRKAHLRRLVESGLRRSQDYGFNAAKRAAFIGPMTIQQQNGHPF